MSVLTTDQRAVGSRTAGCGEGGVPPDAQYPDTEDEAFDALHRSMVDAHDRAHQRLLTIQDIERQHRGIPLLELSALAVSGVLQQPPGSPEAAAT